MSNFSKDLEEQVRLEVRKILETIPVTTKLVNGQWYVIIDITEAENKLTKLALEMY